MSLQTGVPSQQPVRVGVQVVTLYPWNGTIGPYNATTGEPLFGLKNLDLTLAAKSAIAKGGETVFPIAAFETDREVKVKISGCKSSLRLLNVLLGGEFLYDPADSFGLEQQYFTASISDRAPYYRVLAQGINGDGTLFLTFPKLRIDGNISFNLQKDSVTDLEFEGMVVFDYTYVRLDGNIGAPYELFWSQDGSSAPHS